MMQIDCVMLKNFSKSDVRTGCDRVLKRWSIPQAVDSSFSALSAPIFATNSRSTALDEIYKFHALPEFEQMFKTFTCTVTVYLHSSIQFFSFLYAARVERNPEKRKSFCSKDARTDLGLANKNFVWKAIILVATPNQR